MNEKAQEEIEKYGSMLSDFPTVKRLDMNKLKLAYEHTKDMRFYMTAEGKHPIHMILGMRPTSRLKLRKYTKVTTNTR